LFGQGGSGCQILEKWELFTESHQFELVTRHTWGFGLGEPKKKGWLARGNTQIGRGVSTGPEVAGDVDTPTKTKKTKKTFLKLCTRYSQIGSTAT